MLYLNNRIVSEKKALISVFDHGFLYGDGVYETLRAYKGVVYMLDEHIRRLFRSAAMIDLTIPMTPEAIRKAVYETMTANSQKEAVIRISISRGKGPLGLDPALCPKPTLVIMSSEFKKYPSLYYQKGVKIAVVSIRRNYRGALDPQIKSLNFLNNILAKIEAKKRGAYEAVMLNYKGYLAEGTITNIFFLKDNILFTPSISVGILDGITRKIIIDTAGELGIKVHEGRFRQEALCRAHEVFISNTTIEVMPVAEVDDRKVRTSPGKITKALHEGYKRKVIQYITHSKIS
ncbi:MAG: branched-chain-amino-acid transaminase [Nitrospiraceae bacterium]|nr:MAG: branched-chain-amino-acid transaminase [Nitrospiraceae bacterium]